MGLLHNALSPSDEAELEAITEAFADCSRERLIRDPNHCDDCTEVDRYLTSLDRADLVLEEIDDKSGFDYFSMLTDEGFRYFIPSLCRIALSRRPKGMSHLLIRLFNVSARLPDLRHRAALAEFLDYIHCMRYLDDSFERQELEQIRTTLQVRE